MNVMKKRLCPWISALLALLMLLSSVALLSACGTGEDTNVPTGTVDDSAIQEGTAEEDHRFDGVDYDGREFRIYTSTNMAGLMDTSNDLIQGSEEMGAGMVSDAVFERNLHVEELLDIEMVYTQVDLTYIEVGADIRKLTASGIDEYDLVINDIFAFSELLIEGHFRNVMEDECVFDFDRPYWYKDYMEDLRLMDGYQYLMAGDYFIDVLRTAHILLLNKELYKDYFQRSADEIYDVVSNYEWTYEKMTSLAAEVYADKNGDGERNEGDVFGYMDCGYWGATIPFAASGTTNYISRDEDGIPTVVIHEGDRANQLAAAIRNLLNNDCTFILESGQVLQVFAEDQALMTGGVFLGSLEHEDMRAIEGDVAVLPYPMLFSSDKKYTTSAHDTTEMGVILATATDLEYISTVVEVLNRETANILLPKYYKEALQVQLVDDEKAAAMIDIIHDNFDNSFILAYNSPLGGCILQSFWHAAEDEREFSAVYASHQKSVERTLTSKIRTFMKKNNID